MAWAEKFELYAPGFAACRPYMPYPVSVFSKTSYRIASGCNRTAGFFLGNRGQWLKPDTS